LTADGWQREIKAMIARTLAFLLLLGLPCAAQEANPAKAKEERVVMEKELFPLLKEADEVVLYSLYPIGKESLAAEPDENERRVVFGLGKPEGPKEPSEVDKKVAALARQAEVFEGYPVLGKVEIKGAKEIQKVLSEIRAEMVTDEEDGGKQAECFDPRHGILVLKGDRRIVFKICFSCGNSYLSGVPDTAQAGAKAFNDFKKEFAVVLNARFKAAGLIYAPYKDHPPKDGK
jgi:hypothetical protein